MNFLLGQATLEIPLTDTMKTFIGLIGVISIACLILTFVLLCKKVFGRKPSLSKEMEDSRKAMAESHKVLRSEIYTAKNSVLKTMNEKLGAQEKRIDVLDERYEEMQLDRERKWKELKEEYNALNTSLAFIRGKFERKQRRN